MTKKPVRISGVTYSASFYKYPSIVFGIYLSRFFSLFPKGVSDPMLKGLLILQNIVKEMVETVLYRRTPEKLTTPLYMRDLRIMMKEKTRKKIKQPARRHLDKARSNLVGIVLSILPGRFRWMISQRNYVSWSKKEMSGEYVKYIVSRGRDFAKFIGSPGLCLDVGCGNGVIGGKRYDEIGYSYIDGNDFGDFVIGLDPLQMNGPLPCFLDVFQRGRAERIPFIDLTFEKVVFATTLEHTKNPEKALKEASRVCSGSIFIWSTIFNTPGYTDSHHLSRFTYDSLMNLVKKCGLEPVTLRILSNEHSSISDDVFLEVRRSS